MLITRTLAYNESFQHPPKSPSKFCSLRFFFSTTEVINAVFQSNQRFQTIEFVDRPVPERLDIFRSFLFYEQEVLQVECATFKYKATRTNTCVTHT